MDWKSAEPWRVPQRLHQLCPPPLRATGKPHRRPIRQDQPKQQKLFLFLTHPMTNTIMASRDAYVLTQKTCDMALYRAKGVCKCD